MTPKCVYSRAYHQTLKSNVDKGIAEEAAKVSCKYVLRLLIFI